MFLVLGSPRSDVFLYPQGRFIGTLKVGIPLPPREVHWNVERVNFEPWGDPYGITTCHIFKTNPEVILMGSQQVYVDYWKVLPLFLGFIVQILDFDFYLLVHGTRVYSLYFWLLYPSPIILPNPARLIQLCRFYCRKLATRVLL